MMSERLYYAEPFLTSFAAQVSDIREVSRSQGQSLWQIALDRTAFYPTSGGQPYDTGVLSATSPSGVKLHVPVLLVEEDEDGEVWHITAKPLNTGTAVLGEVDWNRRQEHMQQHSGQHLLSAVFLRELSGRTVSFHLGDAVSTIDLAFDKAAATLTLTPEQLARVEDAANRIIAENRPVSVRTLSRQEADALLAAGELRKLPEREGNIRLIEIEGVDLNACGGTHVRSTGQIGGVLIRGTEKMKQSLRVEFVCGLRAARTAREDLATLTRAASALSVGNFGVPEAVTRILAENKAAHRERQKLQTELAGYHAARLLVECPIEERLRTVRRVFPDRDADYIKMLASQLTASAPQTCALLASTQQEPAKVVVASSRDLEINCGAVLRDALASLGLRGGGSADMAQGQLPAAQIDPLFAELEKEFRRSAAQRPAISTEE